MKESIKYFLYGFLFCIGLIGSGITSIILYPRILDSNIIESLKNIYNKKLEHKYLKPPPTEKIYFTENNIHNSKKTLKYNIIFIQTTKELISKIEELNSNPIPTELVLSPGIYKLESTLYIKSDSVKIRSLSSSPVNTIISGGGMFSGEKNLFRVEGSNITFENVTLEKSSLHLIQIAGEQDSSFVKINGCILRDSYQQFIKISYEKNTPNKFSSYGEVSNSVFYFTGKIAPNFYTGGIDGHGVRNWKISRNIFMNLSSPAEHISEHAIHLWNNSAFNIISDNLIINSDRGIGLGLGKINHPNIIYGDYKSKIIDNIVVTTHSRNPFFDAGITLESSFGSEVSGNYVYLQHDYPRAIEYRFPDTKQVNISKNRTNKSIYSRDNGEAILSNNTILESNSNVLELINEYLHNYDYDRRLPDFTREVIKEFKDD